MPQDPYVYPGADCLRNRLGIRDAADLHRVEAERTSAVLALLERQPIRGRYDLDHLRTFHRRIFGDIYDWAGELRTVAIAEEQSLFALPEHIESYLTRVLADLAEDHLLRGLPRQEFVERLAHYYAELNAVHPFREGNGRTLRAFLGQLALDAGYRIAWGADRRRAQQPRLDGMPPRGQRSPASHARRFRRTPQSQRGLIFRPASAGPAARQPREPSSNNTMEVSGAMGPGHRR